MAATAVSESVSNEQVVVFRLEAERYGVDIFRVNEIIRLREITPIPHTAAHVRGLVNLRGKTIPVVDLRVRFGIAVKGDESADKARIIVVESDSGQVGLVVDEVCEVCTLGNATIEPPPSGVGGDYVRGVARREDRLIALLDLDRTLEG